MKSYPFAALQKNLYPGHFDEPVKSLTDGYVKIFAYKEWCLTMCEGIHIVFRASG